MQLILAEIWPYILLALAVLGGGYTVRKMGKESAQKEERLRKSERALEERNAQLDRIEESQKAKEKRHEEINAMPDGSASERLRDEWSRD